jgi:multidrug efflux system outer membrane protein
MRIGTIGMRAAARVLLAAGGCAALLPSCTVGPDYRRPAANAGLRFKSATTQAAGAPGIAPDWWTLFNDPALTDLETAAARANLDLRAAAARTLQARAAAASAYSGFFPVITLDPSIGRGRTPINPTNSVGRGTVIDSTTGTAITGGGRLPVARTVTTARVPFDLSYEVDVWGRVRRQYEAAEAQVRVAEFDYEVVLQTLQADVAQDYFGIRALDLQQEIFQKTVQSYRRQVELTRKQFGAGTVSRIDVAQAESQLRGTLAQQVDIRRQRADLEHALAILLGRPPVEVDIGVRPLDIAPPAVPVAGVPSDLLRRRPDVLEAEQNLIAANAQIGVAIAAFYPSLQLTGSLGFESFDVRHAVDWQQRLWSLGAGLATPIFEGGRLQADVAQARARYDELLARYRSSVLTAARDVEDSLTDLQLRAEQAKEQDEAVRASREYVDLARTQYDKGLIGYLQVIDAERTLLTNEITAAQILNQRLASTVLLIKSLGGGWAPEGPPAPPATHPAPATQP